MNPICISTNVTAMKIDLISTNLYMWEQCGWAIYNTHTQIYLFNI